MTPEGWVAMIEFIGICLFMAAMFALFVIGDRR